MPSQSSYETLLCLPVSARVAIIHVRAYNLSGMSMHIRHGTTDDAQMLSELGAKTFSDAFAEGNTRENMAAYLKKSFSPEIQFAELAAPGNIFLIAENDSKPVGYAQLVMDSAHEAIEGTKPLEIRRIYASPGHIGKGVGSELMKASIAEATQRGCDAIWLGVWEENPRAIEFYRKWGFKDAGTQVFMLGEDPQRDYIMELELE